jgi:hypothetical protein
MQGQRKGSDAGLIARSSGRPNSSGGKTEASKPPRTQRSWATDKSQDQTKGPLKGIKTFLAENSLSIVLVFHFSGFSSRRIFPGFRWTMTREPCTAWDR